MISKNIYLRKDCDEIFEIYDLKRIFFLVTFLVRAIFVFSDIFKGS